MADILLDSDVVIESLRGHPPIQTRLVDLYQQGHILCYSPVTMAEIYHGLRPGEEESTAGFFQASRCLDVTGAVGEKAGLYLAAYHRSHGLTLGDALIAATAHESRARLFTLNRRHYPMKDISYL